MPKKKELTLSELQSRGGKAVKKKYGTSHFSELGKKSAIAKKKKREAEKKKK